MFQINAQDLSFLISYSEGHLLEESFKRARVPIRVNTKGTNGSNLTSISAIYLANRYY